MWQDRSRYQPCLAQTHEDPSPWSNSPTFFKATAILSLCVQHWGESPSCLAQTWGDFQDVDLPGFLSRQTGTSWSPSSWGLASSHKTINKQQILKRAVLCTVCLPCPIGLMSRTSCYKDPTPRKKSCSHFTDRKTENLSENQHLYTAEVHILNHITHFYPTTQRRKPSWKKKVVTMDKLGGNSALLLENWSIVS